MSLEPRGTFRWLSLWLSSSSAQMMEMMILCRHFGKRFEGLKFEVWKVGSQTTNILSRRSASQFLLPVKTEQIPPPIVEQIKTVEGNNALPLLHSYLFNEVPCTAEYIAYWRIYVYNTLYTIYIYNTL